MSINLDSVTVLLGPNGTGKSTVLRALDWFFNGRANALSEQDCSFGAVEEDIEVGVTFCALTAKDRQELGKYATAETQTFTAWKRRSQAGLEVLSANAKGLPEFNAIKAASTATEKKNLYRDLRKSRTALALEAANTGPAVDAAMTAWEATHPGALLEVPEALQTNFFGFNSGGKMSGLFDFVLVAADLRASEETVDGKSSVIGRILERSVDRAAADEAIAKIVESSRVQQQKVYKETYETQLKAMAAQLNGIVSSYSPGRSIVVAPSEIELKAPRTSFEVSVIDGDTETAVERQGHGFQRTLLLSALQVLAQSGAASADGVICLAIEEPELFQHPVQAQAFAKILRSLGEDEQKRIQVVYATHSPYFVEARHFDQVRRLTRSLGPTPEVKVHSATVDDIKLRLDGVMKPTTVDRQLDSMVANQLSTALFAERAFVVEGTTESAVFYGLGDRASLGGLEVQGVSIVPVGGKSTIPFAHAVLVKLGIPTYALFDGDGGFESRAKAKGKTEDEIENERNGHVAANRAVLHYFRVPEVDFPVESVGAEFAVFSDHLETFVKDNWSEWYDACADLEQRAGVSLGKNHELYRSATASAAGMVPPLLVDILDSVTRDV